MPFGNQKTIQRQERGQLARMHLLSELCSICFSFFLSGCDDYACKNTQSHMTNYVCMQNRTSCDSESHSFTCYLPNSMMEIFDYVMQL